MFDRSSAGLEADRELMRLRQGTDTVSDFAIDFQTNKTNNKPITSVHSRADSNINSSTMEENNETDSVMASDSWAALTSTKSLKSCRLDIFFKSTIFYIECTIKI